jgi:hypothetical protein
MAQHSKAALLRRLNKGKKKPGKHTDSTSGFNPPWLKNGKEPNGAVDPVPTAVRRKLAKKYGHAKKKVKNG